MKEMTGFIRSRLMPTVQLVFTQVALQKNIYTLL